MESEAFDSVFDAIADTEGEAANLRARAELMRDVAAQVRSWGLTQEEAATRLGITRPRLNDLLKGKLSKFSLDALVNLTAACGLVLHISTSRAA